MTQRAHEHEGYTPDVCAPVPDVCAQYVIPTTTSCWAEYAIANAECSISDSDEWNIWDPDAWADAWLRDKVVSDLIDGAHGALLSTTTGKPATRAADLVADLWKAEGDEYAALRAELDHHVLDHLDELLSYYSEQVSFTRLPCPDIQRVARRVAAARRRVVQRVRGAREIARARSRTKLARARRPRCGHGRPRLNPRRSPIASNAPPTAFGRTLGATTSRSGVR